MAVFGPTIGDIAEGVFLKATTPGGRCALSVEEKLRGARFKVKLRGIRVFAPGGLVEQIEPEEGLRLMRAIRLVRSYKIILRIAGRLNEQGRGHFGPHTRTATSPWITASDAMLLRLLSRQAKS